MLLCIIVYIFLSHSNLYQSCVCSDGWHLSMSDRFLVSCFKIFIVLTLSFSSRPPTPKSGEKFEQQQKSSHFKFVIRRWLPPTFHPHNNRYLIKYLLKNHWNNINIINILWKICIKILKYWLQSIGHWENIWTFQNRILQ